MLKRCALLLGPIVYAELLKVARNKRWYVLRVVLGLLLLFLTYQAYASSFTIRQGGATGVYTHEQLRRVAAELSIVLIVCQGFAICFLTPVITAGAIAEEKQRKTLHYLLTSQMSSFEIVIGKLFSRFIVLVLPIVICLPVMVILGLLGGIEPLMVLAAYAAILTIALFEGSLAILMSTLARRGRDALFLTFIMGFLWLFGPLIYAESMISLNAPWPDLYRNYMEPINRHLMMTSPLFLISPAQRPGSSLPAFSGPWGWWWAIVAMVVHQALGIVLMLGLAIWQLRPAFRRQDGAPRSRFRIVRAIRTKLRTMRPRKPPGDDAMLWKETVGMPGSLLVTVVTTITVGVMLILAYDTLKEEIPVAVRELVRDGYNDTTGYARTTLSEMLRAINTGVFCVACLVLASMAATSISREREDDTWVSLVSTPLDGINILRAKLIGSLWAIRGLIGMIVLVWIFGVAIGSIHPLGFVLSLGMTTIIFAFILGLGTFISLKTKTTMRAMGLTIGILVFLAMILPMLLAMIGRGSGPSSLVSCFPFLFGAVQMNYREFFDIFYGTAYTNTRMRTDYSAAVVLGGFFYGMASVALLSTTFKAFDVLLDRPRRPGIEM